MNRKSSLVALDQTTAKTIWQSAETKLISTITFDGDLLYAINQDAAIVGLEPATGEIAGKIEMTPNEAPSTVHGGYVTFYTISASEKFVAAYYGNSQELIVFEK